MKHFFDYFVVTSLAAMGIVFWSSLALSAAPSLLQAPTEHEILVRGRYLTKLSGCVHCHSAPGKADFSGGQALRTPVGDFYSPNITPDKTFGIGNWSDSDFIKAVRHGISPRGENYFPAFPFESYALMTNEDLLAIKKYLFQMIPPSSQKNREHAVKTIYSQRWALTAWRLSEFPDEKQKPSVSSYAHASADSIKRGHYLVNGPLHCTQCHTPRRSPLLLGGMISSQWMGGTVTAPNITSDKDYGIGTWTQTDLKNLLLHGVNPHGRVMQQEMDKVVESTRELTPSDLESVVKYIQSLAPNRPNEWTPPLQPLVIPKIGTSAAAEVSVNNEFALEACEEFNSEEWKNYLSSQAGLIANHRYNYLDYDRLLANLRRCDQSLKAAGLELCTQNLRRFANSVGKVGRPGYAYGFLQSDKDYFSNPKRLSLTHLPEPFQNGLPEDWEKRIQILNDRGANWEYAKFRSQLVANKKGFTFDRLTFFRETLEFDQWIQFTVETDQESHHGRNSYVDVITLERKENQKPVIHFREYIRDHEGKNPRHSVAGTSCYNCHPSGPRPFSVDSWSVSPADRPTLTKWNKKMTSLGGVDWAGTIIPEDNGPPLGAQLGQFACVKCHSGFQDTKAFATKNWMNQARGVLNFRTETFHIYAKMVQLMDMPSFLWNSPSLLPLKKALAPLQDPQNWKWMQENADRGFTYKVYVGGHQQSLNKLRGAGLISNELWGQASTALGTAQSTMKQAYLKLLTDYQEDLKRWLLNQNEAKNNTCSY